MTDQQTSRRTPGKPLTRQRSTWERSSTQQDRDLIAMLAGLGARQVSVWWRNVRDGRLKAIVAREPDHPGAGGPLRWHLSISFTGHGSNLRYPTWDEISHARYRLLDERLTMAMLLPPPDEFVAVHDTTFHLHELPEADDA